MSFSSFGSVRHPQCDKMRRAVELLHRADPTLMVDGEVMADEAVSADLERHYPFSQLKGGANVLIFYCTSAFRKLEQIGPGEEAPPFAKFVAAASIFLLIAIIILGRYIPFGEVT